LSSSTEPSEQWKHLSADRRRRIVRSVARGEAVTDPRDARLALELIERREQRLQRAQRSWFWNWLSARHLAVFGVSGVIAGLLTHQLFLVVAAAATPLYLIGVRSFLGRLTDKIASAREENARLLG
jgi:hypothetical protein